MSVDVLESLTRRLQGLTVLRVASPSSVASMILKLPAPPQVTRSASSELWSVAFSPEYGGKPFYYDKSSGKERTQWDRPDVLLARDVNVDMSLFGVDADTSLTVADAVDALREHHDTIEGFLRTADIVTKVLENARVGYEHDVAHGASGEMHKHRRLRRGNAALTAAVFDVAGGWHLLRAVGFNVETKDGETFLVYTPPSSQPHAALDCALSRICTLREGAVKAGAQPTSPSTSRTGGGHTCSHCAKTIDDGTTRLFSGAHDAPPGEFRYECSTCVAEEKPPYVLCEGCWDAYTAGELKHASGHNFETIHPITQRHGTYNSPGAPGSASPWGGLGGGLSVGRARDRLCERTGL